MITIESKYSVGIQRKVCFECSKIGLLLALGHGYGRAWCLINCDVPEMINLLCLKGFILFK